MSVFMKNATTHDKEEVKQEKDIVLSTKESYNICAFCKHYKAGDDYEGTKATCYAKVNMKNRVNYVTGHNTDERVMTDIVYCKGKNPFGHCLDYKEAPQDNSYGR